MHISSLSLSLGTDKLILFVCGGGGGGGRSGRICKKKKMRSPKTYSKRLKPHIWSYMLQFASMKGTPGYKQLLSLWGTTFEEQKMDLKPNDRFIHTVNRSVFFLYSIVIVLALYMFITLKLLLWWNTHRPNFNPPLPLPLPSEKEITIETNLHGTCPEKRIADLL